MIRVHVKQGLVGEGRRETQDLPWSPGVTVQQLRDRLGMGLKAHVVVAVDGHELAGDAEIPDGSTVVVTTVPGEVVLGYLVYALISAAVSVAINYAIQALTPKPRQPGQGQERGDDESPTYSWDGIQTSYGQGLTIPVVLGRHAVGGQVISSDVFPQVLPNPVGSPVNGELLRIVLCLSEGPIRRIGNVEGESARGFIGYTQPPGTLPLPTEIRVNDNLLQDGVPGARAWTRPGTLHQTPLPAPFLGASTLYQLNEALNDNADRAQFTHASTDGVASVSCVIAAPGGVYDQGASGPVAYGVFAAMYWRQQGTTSWNSLGNCWPASSVPLIGYTSRGFTAQLQPSGAPVNGPIEFQIVRSGAAGNPSTVVSALVVRSLTVHAAQEFAYPGCALLALELMATNRTAGALPAFKVRCDGALVRVWDATNGFSPYCWDRPAAPFDFMPAHATPGQNPAWLLGEFLTNKRWGLGNRIAADRIDWEQLRRWSIHCDVVAAGGWTGPQFRCNLVLDAARPAWDTVLAICAAGRAAPIWKGGKLSVVYQYRDAHADAGVSVPAKASVQLITAALCEDVQVRFLPRAQRDTSIQFQFLDEDQAFAQDVAIVDDTEVAIGDPLDPNAEQYLAGTVQAYGVTNRDQLTREGYFMHRTARLVTRELTFECGPAMLAAEVGELIDFQHHLLRPWGDDVPLAMQVVTGGTATTSITVDHAIPSPTGMGWAGRAPDGTPIYRTLTSVTPTTINGRACTIIGLSAAVTVANGAPCAVGLADQITETYQLVAISLARNLRRKVRALQWAPAVWDAVPVAAGADDVEGLGTIEQPDLFAEPPRAHSLQVVAMGRGLQRVVWTRPEHRGTARGRVYVRIEGIDVWTLLGESPVADLTTDRLVAGRRYEVAVTLENETGMFELPDAAARLAVTPDEFPAWSIPAPTNFTATQSAGENLVQLRWDQGDPIDLDHYEVRCGTDWASGTIVYRGRLAQARLRPPPAFTRYQVAARSLTGLYGPRAALTITLQAIPYAGAVTVNTTSYAPTGSGGTHSNTAVDSTTEPALPFIALTAGQLSGTFTSAEIDLGYQAPFFLRVAIDPQELDGTAVDDWTFGVASGEARWRTIDTRPASAARAGIDWSTLVDDLTMTIDDLPADLRAAGSIGEIGSNVLCRVESRTFTGGAWSAWSEHVDRLVVCSKWQSRLVLARATTARSVRARTFRMEALI